MELINNEIHTTIVDSRLVELHIIQVGFE